jgi:hypothetical protein
MQREVVDGFKASFEHDEKCYSLLLKFVGVDAYLCGIWRMHSNNFLFLLFFFFGIMFRAPSVILQPESLQ